MVQFLMAPTHTVEGVNYADVWHWMLTVLGSALAVTGLLLSALSRAWTHRAWLTELEPAV
jgi:hypothetical protein